MGDLSLFEVVLAVAAVLGVGKLLELLVNKLLHRKADDMSDRKVAAEIVSSEVATVRGVLAEVQKHSDTKDKIIDQLQTDLRGLAGRIERMEAREHQNHALTAAHEVWDIQVFQRMVALDPTYPPPPPLRAPLVVEGHYDVPGQEAPDAQH